jgi:hypothetical protein
MPRSEPRGYDRSAPTASCRSSCEPHLARRAGGSRVGPYAYAAGELLVTCDGDVIGPLTPGIGVVPPTIELMIPIAICFASSRSRSPIIELTMSFHATLPPFDRVTNASESLSTSPSSGPESVAPKLSASALAHRGMDPSVSQLAPSRYLGGASDVARLRVHARSHSLAYCTGAGIASRCFLTCFSSSAMRSSRRWICGRSVPAYASRSEIRFSPIFRCSGHRTSGLPASPHPTRAPTTATMPTTATTHCPIDVIRISPC